MYENPHLIKEIEKKIGHYTFREVSSTHGDINYRICRFIELFSFSSFVESLLTQK